MARFPRVLWLAGPLVVVVLLVGGRWDGWRGVWRTASWTDGPENAQVSGRASASPSAERVLAAMAWTDIQATLEGTNGDLARRRELLEASWGSTRDEVVYLRGLLLLAENRPEEALAAFMAIDPQHIPPLALYAPHRVYSTLRPGAPNPFLASLLQARSAQQLTPLVAARVAAEEGDLRGALLSYLKSDPGQWARHDLVAFRLLRLHAGLAADAGVMIAAALRGGRVRADLRDGLAGVMSEADGAASESAMKDALTSLLKKNPGALALAVDAAGAQLRTRRRFLQHRYADLVREFRSTDPVSLPDGTLVILVLCATHTGDVTATDLWAQELLRRYPRRDVDRWIQDLKSGRL